jgi:hypothetical protein
VPGLNVPNTAAGSEFNFAGSKWRILKEDMNNNASDGKQALVIKVDALTNGETGQAGTATDAVVVNFHDYTLQKTYFDATGQNGYETSIPKKLIDYYYANTIDKSADVQYVLGVELNNPTFAQFSQGLTWESGKGTYDSWQWNNYYTDRRFATTLNDQGTKQAFALSNGDINVNRLDNANDPQKSDLLAGFNAPDSFWLRSAGHSHDYAARVRLSTLTNQYVLHTLPVRPALALQIK